MPIRTIVNRAIESAEHGNGGILLNATDGSASNAGSFLVLDASKASTVDVNEKIEFGKRRRWRAPSTEPSSRGGPPRSYSS